MVKEQSLRELIERLRAHLEEMWGIHPVRLRVDCQEGEDWIVLPMRRGDEISPNSVADDESHWEDVLRRVLQEADQPLKAGTLARRAGKDPGSSYLRKVLHRMQAHGEVYRPFAGEYRYWLRSRPLPGGTNGALRQADLGQRSGSGHSPVRVEEEAEDE